MTNEDKFNTSKKIRIGLILDSPEVFAWIFHAIERLYQSESASIEMVIYNNPGENQNKNGSRYPAISRLYKIVDALDRKIFIRENHAFNTKSLNKILEQSKQISLFSDSTEEFKITEVLQEIKSENLDLLIDLSAKPVNHEIHTFTRYGTWSYRFGENEKLFDRFYAYWEVIKKSPTTKAKLVINSNQNEVIKVIIESEIATYKLSPNRNRDSISWFAATFLVRNIEYLYNFGGEKFFERIQQNNHLMKSKNENAFKVKSPSSWEVIKNGLILIGRISKSMLHRFMYKESWFLMIHEGQDPNFAIEGSKKIIPPDDRFWADPFIIDYEGNNFIFVEEFLYKKNIGHISVLELSQSGDLKKYYPILETDYHLSYPCVFNHSGTYYMVPESSSKRSIDLFECQVPFSKWKYKFTIMDNVNAVDPTLFFYRGKWWLFTGMREIAGVYPDVELFLFYSESLFSEIWTPHPCNPIVSDVSRARPAGMPFIHKDKLYRPSQNCLEFYGSSFNINEIINLSESDYKEEKLLTVHPGNHKQIQATHTFNFYSPLSVMDGLFWKHK